MRPGSIVRHVLWDWNGTLLDDVAHCVSVMNELLDDAGLGALSREHYQRVFDFPVKNYYQRLGFDLTGDRWERLAARFIERYDAGVGHCSLHEGVVDLLSLATRGGARNVILSAARRDSIEALAEAYGIRALLHDIVGLSNHYAHGKVELGLSWLAESSADPSCVLFVGDTVHDHEVAEAMGVACVLVASGHHARDRLEATGRRIVSSLVELAEVLLEPPAARATLIR